MSDSEVYYDAEGLLKRVGEGRCVVNYYVGGGHYYALLSDSEVLYSIEGGGWISTVREELDNDLRHGVVKQVLPLPEPFIQIQRSKPIPAPYFSIDEDDNSSMRVVCQPHLEGEGFLDIDFVLNEGVMFAEGWLLNRDEARKLRDWLNEALAHV